MIKLTYVVMLILFACLNSGCSSAPEKQYRVTKYLDLANTWMARGDRKRQEEKLDLALSNYQTSYKYANMRNDLTLMGILHLKQATIHINQNRIEQASDSIDKAKALRQYEGADILLPIKSLEAKFEYVFGKASKAESIANELSATYKNDSEKHIYYRWLSWMYSGANSLDWAEADSDLKTLKQLKSTGTLDNIEIFSFVIYYNAKWRVQEQDARAVSAIEMALQHFSELELTNRIKDCYALAVQWYEANDDKNKAAYFSMRLKELSTNIPR
ncbi:hypothetical protein [Pseudoalteromonas luteoviolacea]|uniref:Uncharacterized protein n=1 Tax=Pseudoalteromonas luteoviolacea S4054 TaxID=1129367 RepID=A0A0F6ADF4_9GAMM|nr:hypothetical protein [Pseudoalteromonas luteoviolacea]AOT08587.1 hypothetical protein S4054249_12320 [Pseudoalteromonas luteoviolacea]AOT13503.1 hypothetical protein S40542_12295 [Pseudoalteromonas luteoviolacea]AOT18416.1 hypothetical protein S4054_12295 [Pseudoalteromonas luteoviolacea]KKE83414.1 hypothetical protein N479_13670 [Pseudoalteromonas luteoviolacea S4054]KZN75851.1 hypothetical protein N481_05765 [Pseudoalteromonas luteoviolacea S4047-1]